MVDGAFFGRSAVSKGSCEGPSRVNFVDSLLNRIVGARSSINMAAAWISRARQMASNSPASTFSEGSRAVGFCTAIQARKDFILHQGRRVGMLESGAAVSSAFRNPFHYLILLQKVVADSVELCRLECTPPSQATSSLAAS